MDIRGDLAENMPRTCKPVAILAGFRHASITCGVDAAWAVGSKSNRQSAEGWRKRSFVPLNVGGQRFSETDLDQRERGRVRQNRRVHAKPSPCQQSNAPRALPMLHRTHDAKPSPCQQYSHVCPVRRAVAESTRASITFLAAGFYADGHVWWGHRPWPS